MSKTSLSIKKQYTVYKNKNQGFPKNILNFQKSLNFKKNVLTGVGFGIIIFNNSKGAVVY